MFQLTSVTEKKLWALDNVPAKKPVERSFNTRGAGIGGLLRRQEEGRKADASLSQEAFADLDSLVNKARDMVRFYYLLYEFIWGYSSCITEYFHSTVPRFTWCPVMQRLSSRPNVVLRGLVRFCWRVVVAYVTLCSAGFSACWYFITTCAVLKSHHSSYVFFC